MQWHHHHFFYEPLKASVENDFFYFHSLSSFVFLRFKVEILWPPMSASIASGRRQRQNSDGQNNRTEREFSTKDMPCAFNMQAFVRSISPLKSFSFTSCFEQALRAEKFAWSSLFLSCYPRKNLNRVTSPARASKINRFWNLLFFFYFISFPPVGWTKNCFIDHKLRLAPRRCFGYNRERWNINIVSSHTKCKTVWLGTVSGEYFMLFIQMLNDVFLFSTTEIS